LSPTSSSKKNRITFKRVSTTLEVKKPTYNEVKNEAFKHDTLYNKLKTNYAAKSRRASKLRNDIKTLEIKCEQIKEESKRKQEERRKIMSDTKMLLKTKGEILTNIDKRKYQLLIEKEQFAAANKIIEKENSCFKNNIETMESSDKIVANQIQEFNDGLRLLTSHLSNARQDFTKFSAETKTRGSRLICDLEKLVENQEYKSCVYTTVISTCTKLNDELRDILNSSKVQLQ